MYLVESETAQKVWDSVLAKMKNEYDVNAYSTFFLPLISSIPADTFFVSFCLTGQKKIIPL